MSSTDDIIVALSSYSFSVSDEKYLQSEIAEVFAKEGIEFQREVRLSNGIIDFMVGDIGIEVKIRCQPVAIYRQIERYLEDERLSEIILATVRRVTLPEKVKGKRARSVLIRGGVF